MMAKGRMRSKILIAIGVALFCALPLLFSKRRPVLFSIEAISSDLSYHPEWETGPASEAAQRALSQKYTYLARGAQSFAFLSEDGKYVVKFFRMKHLQSKLKDHFRPGVVKRRAENLQSIFSAHKLAWDELKEETGLVFLHLNKSCNLNLCLEVKDWLGRTHKIDLDKTEFVLQEKAELIFTHMKKVKEKEGIKGVEKTLAAFLGLVQTQIDRGIFDRDKAVSHNYGFVGDKPVHLDIGRLTKGEKLGEYERIYGRVAAWLKENAPEVLAQSSGS